MSFLIRIHSQARVLEVVYPAVPTVSDMTAYLLDVKSRIDDMGSRWSCLVDQREVKDIPERLKEKIALMNTYGIQRGMSRCARVVSSASSDLDARALITMTKATVPMRVFTSRDEALAWLSTDSIRPESIDGPKSSRGSVY